MAVHDVNSVLDEMRSEGNEANRKGMARYGINTEKAVGVSMVWLRKKARSLGKEHRLALDLWDSEVHEARILATLIDEPELVSRPQMAENDFWKRVFLNREDFGLCKLTATYGKDPSQSRTITPFSYKKISRDNYVYESIGVSEDISYPILPPIVFPFRGSISLDVSICNWEGSESNAEEAAEQPASGQVTRSFSYEPALATPSRQATEQTPRPRRNFSPEDRQHPGRHRFPE